MLRAILRVLAGIGVYYLVATNVFVYLVEFPEELSSYQELADWHGFFSSIVLSAICSGLTVGLMSLDRLQLEKAAQDGDADAQRVLGFRIDSNRLLATLIWTNVFAMVFAEVFLARRMHGWLHAFLTVVVVTIVSELIPIAVLTRYGLRFAGPLTPAVSALQIVMWPVAKPSAMILDWVIGRERFEFLGQKFVLWILHSHSKAPDSEIGPIEGTIAANALRARELSVMEEGELLDPKSVLELPFHHTKKVKNMLRQGRKEVVARIRASRRKWVVFTYQGEPTWVLDADAYLVSYYSDEKTDVENALHKPLVLKDPNTPLSQVLATWEIHKVHPHDNRIHRDVALVWAGGENERRIITGTDILGLLTQGVANVRFVDEALSPGSSVTG